MLKLIAIAFIGLSLVGCNYQAEVPVDEQIGAAITNPAKDTAQSLAEHGIDRPMTTPKPDTEIKIATPAPISTPIDGNHCTLTGGYMSMGKCVTNHKKSS